MAQENFYFRHSYSSNPSSEKNANQFEEISDQKGDGNCYAHAAAHAIMEAENRTFCRNVPTHESLVKEITDEYGTNGGSSRDALEWQCNKRKLRFREVNFNDAWEAVTIHGRVIVTRFRMNEGQWDNFRKHFKKTPQNVCEPKDIGSGKSGEKDGAHAVAIISGGFGQYGKKYWVLKNSWGNTWGDRGLFRLSCDFVKHKKYQMEFYEVFFRVKDLTDDAWKTFKRIIAQE